MSKEGALLVMIGVALVLIGLMAWGWWRRSRRDGGLVAPRGEVPEGAVVRAEFAGLYVATTAHGAPLERLAIRGLGFRAAGEVVVTDAGLALRLRGSDTVFLDRDRLVSAAQATVAIDRVVERDGLLRVTWLLGDTPLDSYFRPQGTSARDAAQAVTAILPHPTPTGTDA